MGLVGCIWWEFYLFIFVIWWGYEYCFWCMCRLCIWCFELKLKYFGELYLWILIFDWEGFVICYCGWRSLFFRGSVLNFICLRMELWFVNVFEVWVVIYCVVLYYKLFCILMFMYLMFLRNVWCYDGVFSL